MAWSAPMTAVANATLSAAQWNASVRDNLNATAVALATAAGQYPVATGVNALAMRTVGINTVLTTQTSTSGVYADMTTPGPSVTVNCSVGALVFIQCAMSNSGVNGATTASFEISGATSRSAGDGWRIVSDGNPSANTVRYGAASYQAVNPGSNTFKMKYLVGSGTGTYSNREIIVMPF